MPRKIQEYLQLAGEAEERARNASNDDQKTHWRDIANGYRNLAQARLNNLAPLEQSSPLPAPHAKPEK